MGYKDRHLALISGDAKERPTDAAAEAAPGRAVVLPERADNDVSGFDTATGEVELPSAPSALQLQPGAPLPPRWAIAGADQRRPVVAPWLRSPADRRSAARWAVHHLAHMVAFHAVRVPQYVLLLLSYLPRGLWRLGTATGGWLIDTEGLPLRLAAVRAGDSKLYLSLAKERADRVRARRILFAVALIVAGCVAFAAWNLLPVAARWVAFGVALVAVAAAGKPSDRRLLQPAVITGPERRLSPDTVVRAFLRAGLCRDDDPITFRTPIHRDGNGWRVVINLPFGVPASRAMTRAMQASIASGLDVNEGQLFLSTVGGASGSARQLDMWVCEVDPLLVAAGPSPLIRASRVNFWQEWPLGVDPRGNEVRVSLLWAAILVGAIPRQGKTFTARLFALAAALDPHVRLYVYDLKGSADWMPFFKIAHRFQLGDRRDPETGVDPVQALLDDMLELQAEVDERYRRLRKLPPELCPEGKLTEDLARNSQFGMPQVLVSIDEVQRAFEHPDLGKQLEDVLTDLVKVGPAVGVMFLCATQKPDKTATPPRFRDQFGIRFCLRVTAWQVSDVILGAGAYSEGLDGSKLPPDGKGCGILRGTGDTGTVTGGQTVRTYLADGRDTDAICTRARALRQAAGTLTGAALGEMPTTREEGHNVAADVLLVLGDDSQAHSDDICSRLAEGWPDRYAGWAPSQLSAALAPYGVRTGQVWATSLDGHKANRYGVRRADLHAALGGTD